MDDRTSTSPAQRAHVDGAHRAAANQARIRTVRRRGRRRVAAISVTLFVALFSLLSYRMYAGLDPSTGSASAATTTASLGDRISDLETAIEEALEDESDDDSDESHEDVSTESSSGGMTTAPTTPQPTTRAS